MDAKSAGGPSRLSSAGPSEKTEWSTGPSGPLAVVALVLLAVNLRLVFGSSSAVTTQIEDAYHLRPASLALLTTAPVLCLGLFGPLAPRALRRWSVPSVLVACLALISLGTAARGIPSWPVLLVGTLLAGIGIAVANVLGPVFVRLFFPHRIGVMTGLLTALVSASAGIASGLTVPITSALTHSWRITLLAWAVAGVVALLVFVGLARHHTSAERSMLAQSTTSRHPVMSVWRSSTAWAVTGFMGIQALLAYAMIAWLPTIYVDRGLTAQASGLVLTALSVASVVTALTVPMLATRIRDQRLLAVGVVALSVAGLIGVLAGGPHSAVMWAVVWAILLGLGQGGQLSLALTMVNLRSQDAETTASLSTMAQSIGYLIAALGPVVTGALHGMTGGWTEPLLVLIALMVPLAACGWLAGADRTVGPSSRTVDLNLPPSPPARELLRAIGGFGPGLVRPRPADVRLLDSIQDAGLPPGTQTVTVRALPQVPRLAPAAGVVEGARPWRRLRTSLTTFVVEHPQATFLIDPAYCRDASTRALNEHPWVVRKVATPPAATIATVDSLNGAGITADFALPTHAHWDHVCGLLDLPGLPVHLHGLEREWIGGSDRPPVGGVKTALTDGRPLVNYDLDGPSVATFSASHDLFGDASVLLVDLPGHTPGSVGVLARTPDGWVLIAGDAAWHHEQVALIRQKPSFPGEITQVDFDRDVAFATLHRLHLARRLMRVIPTHDHAASEHLTAGGVP